jgi:hypothetical protein
MEAIEDTKTKTEEITDHIEGFAETFLELSLTTVAQKGIKISSVFINALLVYILAIFVLLFTAAGLAWWLGDVLHNRAGGFFMVAGIFFLITLLIILLRKKFIYPFIRNSLVRKVYE